MRVKFGNSTKDVPLLEVTAENYIVPEGEEGTWHCRIEQMQFSPTSGKRLSRPRIQKFENKMWPALRRNLKQQGWDIVILHDPTEWLREQEEKAQMTAEQRLKKEREAEEKKRAAERKAIREEILAELREQGIIPEKKKELKTGGSKGK